MENGKFPRSTEADLRGATVLIVHESPLQGTDLYTLVATHNGRALGPLTSVADGLAMVKTVALETAVIDGEMENWEALADRLDFRQIPYIIQSGSALDLKPGIICKQYVWLSRPADVLDVLSALRTVCERRKLPRTRKAD